MASKKKGARSFKRKPKHAVSPDMNVTPLVDVVLVLLIIFMVLAPVVSAHYLARLPPPDDKDQALAEANPDNKPLVLRVEAERDASEAVYKVGSIELSPDEAAERLGRLAAGRDDKVIYVDASEQTPYGFVLQAMSFAKDSEDIVNGLVAEKAGKDAAELPRLRVTAVLVTKEIPVQ
ncbi:biopolymer transporter ExbD [Pseudenhygromyxa sp. WMMC2535]|uniref:ExbD/TolR family protein n=1 Tax=Pseudenhygromyxa sp. WMMC2535 TaxID=2712867 RepID=UPI0015539EEB|nr:biopolymer transporter ExbD [Pseudenhygromyxa sp. WMMC2535]NVB43263.1 biopolymer transporter ExbD [Pseudenhygromyxa sp. WMMC2535]